MYPATKLRNQETPLDAAHRLLQDELGVSLVALTGSRLELIDTEIEVGASLSFGLQTKYVRRIFRATLDGPCISLENATFEAQVADVMSPQNTVMRTRSVSRHIPVVFDTGLFPNVFDTGHKVPAVDIHMLVNEEHVPSPVERSASRRSGKILSKSSSDIHTTQVYAFLEPHEFKRVKDSQVNIKPWLETIDVDARRNRRSSTTCPLSRGAPGASAPPQHVVFDVPALDLGRRSCSDIEDEDSHQRVISTSLARRATSTVV